jgi:hypothetical protein
MYEGEANWNTLLKQFPNIEVFLSQQLYDSTSVVVMGTDITLIRSNNSGNIQEWQARVYIDSSYDGDLTRFSKCDFTYGREPVATYSESYAGIQPHTNTGNFLVAYPIKALFPNGTLLPYIKSDSGHPIGTGDENLQAYSYRLCITTNKTNQAPFPKPPNYDPNDFILLQLYINSLISSGKYPQGPSFDYLVDVLPYRGYPPNDKWDLCDSANSAFTSDAVNLNSGYVTATDEQRKEIQAKHYYFEAGLLYYLYNDPSVPVSTQNSIKRYGLCKDQWLDNNHWPPQIYIREGLRLIGDNVTTQHQVINAHCVNDSIAIGSWSIDIHVVERIAYLMNTQLVADNEGQIVVSTQKPYGISYSIMLPKRKNLSNLLVPVCNSASHVAYGAIRVEPTFVQIGQAAGIAATLVVQQNVAVQDIQVSHVQNILKIQGASYQPSTCM